MIYLTKQYVNTINETHVAWIQDALPVHTVIYIGRNRGFYLSGVPHCGKTAGELGQSKGSQCKHLQTKKHSGKAGSSSTVYSGQNPTPMAAVPIHLSRDFAKQHDEAISTVVATTLELGDLVKRRQAADAKKDL